MLDTIQHGFLDLAWIFDQSGMARHGFYLRPGTARRGFFGTDWQGRRKVVARSSQGRGKFVARSSQVRGTYLYIDLFHKVTRPGPNRLGSAQGPEPWPSWAQGPGPWAGRACGFAGPGPRVPALGPGGLVLGPGLGIILKRSTLR